MTDRPFDAVVVGAGPAGSVAALVLARGGARVALADKASFPRDKACGDLVGPRGVQVLAELGVGVPDAGQGSDLLAVGPSGRASKLPAFPGRSYADHGVVVPRLVFDNALREAAVAAGAVPVQARITAVDADGDGIVRAVIASDGRRLAADVIIGADGALSPLARLAGMLDPDTALWGFAIRAYLPAEVPLPLLVLLDARPWRIYPGYGWLFPGADGQANVGIGVGLGTTRRQAPLRGDLARFCARAGRARRHRARRHAGAGHRRLAADGRYRDARCGRQRASGRRRGGPDQPAAGRGDRARDGQRPAGCRGRARSPGGPRPRLHRGAGRRVRRLYARGRGAADRPAAAATGRFGGNPAADRARGAPGFWPARGRSTGTAWWMAPSRARPPGARAWCSERRGCLRNGSEGGHQLPGPPPSPAAWLADPGPGPASADHFA